MNSLEKNFTETQWRLLGIVWVVSSIAICLKFFDRTTFKNEVQHSLRLEYVPSLCCLFVPLCSIKNPQSFDYSSGAVPIEHDICTYSKFGIVCAWVYLNYPRKRVAQDRTLLNRDLTSVPDCIYLGKPEYTKI